MSFNVTPRGERLHIGIFGRRNVGKSSLINRLTNQETSLVSDVMGTTTDPVLKAMELAGLGPVVLMDTAGLDDTGMLGEKRVERTLEILRKTDIALMVMEYDVAPTPLEMDFIGRLEKAKIPFITVVNKSESGSGKGEKNCIYVSAATGSGIEALKEGIITAFKAVPQKRELLLDIIPQSGLAVLVTPIDQGAPKGRLILPQQQVIRELLDGHRQAMVVQPQELSGVLDRLKTPPDLVVVDSQVVGQVAGLVPTEIPLTTFSVLFARYKGILADSVAGVAVVKDLRDGDRVLVSEGCTHHRQCEDIGTKKIPGWLAEYTGRALEYDFTSGGEFPKDVSGYSLIIHCGGCTLNQTEVENRMKRAKKQGVPMTNYGVFISMVHGYLERIIRVFPPLANTLKAQEYKEMLD